MSKETFLFNQCNHSCHGCVLLFVVAFEVVFDVLPCLFVCLFVFHHIDMLHLIYTISLLSSHFLLELSVASDT